MSESARIITCAPLKDPLPLGSAMVAKVYIEPCYEPDDKQNHLLQWPNRETGRVWRRSFDVCSVAFRLVSSGFRIDSPNSAERHHHALPIFVDSGQQRLEPAHSDFGMGVQDDDHRKPPGFQNPRNSDRNRRKSEPVLWLTMFSGETTKQIGENRATEKLERREEV